MLPLDPQAALDFLRDTPQVTYPALTCAGIGAGRLGLWAGGRAFSAFARGLAWAVTPAEPEPLPEAVAMLIERVVKAPLRDGSDCTLDLGGGGYVSPGAVYAGADYAAARDVSGEFTRPELRAVLAAHARRVAELAAERREKVRVSLGTGLPVS